MFFELRAQCHQGRVGLLEFTDNILQSIQLRVAVGSPVAAKYGKYYGAFREQVLGPDQLTVTWESDKDGPLGTSVPASSGAVVFPWSSLSVNSHAVTMTVTDDLGESCADTVVLTVGTPPFANISSPQVNAAHPMGDSVSFAGVATDAEDPNTALDVEWTSSIDGALVLDGDADSSGEFEDYGYLSEGQHTIELTVTDSGGKTVSESIVVQVGGPNSPPLLRHHRAA